MCVWVPRTRFHGWFALFVSVFVVVRFMFVSVLYLCGFVFVCVYVYCIFVCLCVCFPVRLFACLLVCALGRGRGSTND